MGDNSRPGSLMREESEDRARKVRESCEQRRYLEEAMRFLDDACNSWRALAVHWTEAGDDERAREALESVKQCELRRLRIVAALEQLSHSPADQDAP